MVASQLKALYQRVAAEKRFSYTRSDGSQQPLTMRDVIARCKGLEMGYNPNDCIEIRWAASGVPVQSTEEGDDAAINN